MNTLKKHWKNLTSIYSQNTNLSTLLWNEIEQNYSENNRFYHNLSHIQYMTNKAIEYKNILIDFNTILFSIFYHDITYNVKKKNNEIKSVHFAKSRLIKKLS